jgi:hypothetical protein
MVLLLAMAFVPAVARTQLPLPQLPLPAIAVGQDPEALVFDGTSPSIWVANQFSDNVMRVGLSGSLLSILDPKLLL